MKRIIPLCLLLFSCTMAISQIVASSHVACFVKIAGTNFISQKDLDRLKTTKTYFIVPNCVETDVEVINEKISEVWDFTPIKAIRYKDIEKINDDNISYFTIYGVFGDEEYLVMKLIIPQEKRNIFGGKYDKVCGYFFLTPTNQHFVFAKILAMQNSALMIMGKTSEELKNEINYVKSLSHGEFLFEYVKYHNLGLGHLCTYLAILNKALKDPKSQQFENNFRLKPTNAKLIHELKTNTLYIPEYIRTQEKGAYGPQMAKKIPQSEFMKGYPYKYEFISEKELDELILKSEEPVYFLNFFRGNNVFVIFKSTTHEVVYSAQGRLTFSKSYLGISNSFVQDLVKKLNPSK